jgi:hypothetical protein
MVNELGAVFLMRSEMPQLAIDDVIAVIGVVTPVPELRACPNELATNVALVRVKLYAIR